MNLLKRARVYCAGNLEYTSDSKNWRQSIKDTLGPRGVSILSPIEPMFVGQQGETPEFRASLLDARANLEFDKVEEFMKGVIERDLRMIDIADFCIFNIETEKPTFGTLHELVVATQQQKPVFVTVTDLSKCPLWIIGLVKRKHLYASIDEIIDTVIKIDSGDIVMNSKKWKLLNPELR